MSNTAIFYDIENLSGLFGAKTNTFVHLDEIYKKVQAIESVNGISVQRAYTDWSLPCYKAFRATVLQLGIEAIHVFNSNPNDRTKNASDVCLIIDAVDLLARRPEIKNFVIASGDGIFAFLAKKLHEHGKFVIGCSFENISSAIFRNSCDYFIGLGKNDEGVVTVSPTVSGVVVPRQFSKNKTSEALFGANIKICDSAVLNSDVLHTVCKMVEAVINNSLYDLPASMEVSSLFNYMTYFLPNFKPGKQGFKKAGDFIRFVLTGSDYCVFKAAANILRFSQRAKAGGKILEDFEGLTIASEKGVEYKSFFDVPPEETITYTHNPPPKPPPEPPVPVPEPAPEPAPAPDFEEEIAACGGLRKWVKEALAIMSANNIIPPEEIAEITKDGTKIFGVRMPVLVEVGENDDVNKLRMVKNRPRYWKELFRFNGKDYIVFKDWVAATHQERFIAWYTRVKNG